MTICFDFNRFIKLFSNEIRLNYQKSLLFWGGVIMLVALYFIFHYIEKNILNINSSTGALIALLIITQGFYMSIHVGEFASKRKTQSLLMLPASQSEVFFSKFLMNFILYPLLAGFFFLIIIKLALLYNFSMDPDWETRFNNSKSWINYLQQPMAGSSMFIIWLFVCSIYFWGVMTFKKYACLKSVLFWAIFILMLVFVLYCICCMMFDEKITLYIPFVVIQLKGDNLAVNLFDFFPYLLHWIVIFMSIALLAMSWIKLKEKTI